MEREKHCMQWIQSGTEKYILPSLATPTHRFFKNADLTFQFLSWSLGISLTLFFCRASFHLLALPSQKMTALFLSSLPGIFSPLGRNLYSFRSCPCLEVGFKLIYSVLSVSMYCECVLPQISLQAFKISCWDIFSPTFPCLQKSWMFDNIPTTSFLGVNNYSFSNIR